MWVTGKSCLKTEKGELLDTEEIWDFRSSTLGNDGEGEDMEKEADGVQV